MQFLPVVLLVSQLLLKLIQAACNNGPPDQDLMLPVIINNNENNMTYQRGCITNTTFLNNAQVHLLEIDCSDEQLPEIPKGFISSINTLKGLLIKCSVKTIQAGAFSNLPSLIDLDLSGNKLLSLEYGILLPIPSLKYLNLSYNSIVFIEDKAFGNMPHLADLDLGHNNLNFLRAEWFSDTKTIEEFYFNNNLLKEISGQIFNGWTKTYAFNFDYNQISTIQDGAFTQGPEEINYLSLHHNNLTTINRKAFSAPIKQLDISSNLLANLPLDVLETIQVKYIWIYGNPFECTCLMDLEIALQAKKAEIIRPLMVQEKCQGSEDVPVCAMRTTTTTTNNNAPYNRCDGTNEVPEITNRMVKYLRKLGFLDLKDWYEQCSVLALKAYLET